MFTECDGCPQALSVRWTQRSLLELQRARPQLRREAHAPHEGEDSADGQEDASRREEDSRRQEPDSLDQERDRLQAEVRRLRDWLEDTYRQQLQQLDSRLRRQRDDILQVEADLRQKADALAEDPLAVIDALRQQNERLRLKLAEMEQRQSGLQQQVAAHEHELDGLREYFQEKVKFTEKMREQAELDGSFTDLGLPDGDDTVGPSVLRLRVEFERRIATLRQQLGRKLASQTRDVRTELERKHRKEVTELERKHLTKMAQTVERYKKEAEAGRREAERQISEVRNQLIQEHQDEVQRLTQKHQEQKAESAGPAERRRRRPACDDAAGGGGGTAGARCCWPSWRTSRSDE
ncbi:cingulin-like protein 1 [Pollicipes pollicipes]|uniref:cingulin-like protein 1 n=1 Tax=Pollicipes pollicipes TaxID=41117 RepID=UPI001884C694|nr:cingulin-like protein 1 [Pollicipes pollicipes]